MTISVYADNNRNGERVRKPKAEKHHVMPAPKNNKHYKKQHRNKERYNPRFMVPFQFEQSNRLSRELCRDHSKRIVKMIKFNNKKQRKRVKSRVFVECTQLIRKLNHTRRY